jgi:HNH endonuclease
MPRRAVPPLERIIAQIEEVDGCWLYRGHVGSSQKYAQIMVPGIGYPMVHRLMYEAAYGPMPDGLQTDHLCRQTLCCRPSHMEAVTPRENTLRSNGITAVNARKGFCPKGHSYAEHGRSRPGGGRACGECHRIKGREQGVALMAAARALGLTRAAYIAEHGQSMKKAVAIAASL